jgi:hypothetical protein
MSTLLEHLEGNLRAMDTWPTLILRLLFQADPSPQTILILGSFFYGNSIPEDVAAPFYALCIGRNQNQITISIPILFQQWRKDVHDQWLTLYYDMTTNCFMCLHGSASPERREPLPFHVGDVYEPLGFAGMGGRTPQIDCRLRRAAETPVPRT